MAQRLRILAALPEDHGWITNTYMAAKITSVPGDPITLQRYICKQNINTHKKELSKKFKESKMAIHRCEKILKNCLLIEYL